MVIPIVEGYTRTIEGLERQLRAERALADDLARAANDVENEWNIRGDGGCSVWFRGALGNALARYRKARER
jgi:predicted lipoprotein